MGKFELISLPYEANALEPVISAQTIGFHHGKHLQGYVNNLNAAIEGTPFADKDLVEIVKILQLADNLQVVEAFYFSFVIQKAESILSVQL